MMDPRLKELELGRYQRILSAAASAECPLALCDPAGAPVRSSGGTHEDELRRSLLELGDRGFEWEPDAARSERCQVGAGATLLYCRIGSAEARVGWLATLYRGGPERAGGEALQRLAETLEHLSECIAAEWHLAGEMQGLATELADRYEELNLIYSLHGQGLCESEQAIPAFLRSFADLMSVDLAAFVATNTRAPLYATNLSQPIYNLDLVLVALRGDLFRFLAASARILVLNRPDDPRRRFIMTNMPYKLLACPVARGKTVDRMLVLLRHPQRPDFSNSDRNLAATVADQVALMLQNESMLRSMRRFGEQTAGALIEAVEAKDPYTRGHSERVQALSIELGRALGLRDLQLEDLYWGSIFHDVGKLGIPDAVLCKPDRLTPDEYAFIRIHPERSYEILKHIEYLRKDALDAARHHHERFDGAGYPHGLVGRAIPLHARVIAVADTYDAMTSSRSYRPGRSHEEAMEEIQRVAGQQLDPEVVQVMVRTCAEGRRWPEAVELSSLAQDA